MRQVSHYTLLVCLCLTACLLSACGGGSSSSSSGAATYAIGVDVSGLTQLSGVVLENNGGDALTVSAEGSSTFTSRVASGNPYDVTVQTQPTGETCTVGDNAQGTASGAVSVSVTCTSNYANASAANVVPISVNAGPADSGDQTFNIPLVTVTVCEPNTQTCATIPNVLVDTGSSGLRLISSALTQYGPNVTLKPMMDPNNPSNTIDECMLFADGYSWGGVVYATVTIGGEATASTTGIPVQIIDSSTSPSPAAPSDCSNQSSQTENTVDDFDANGVLGVGLLNQDCGSTCVGGGTGNDNDTYYTCPTSGSCSSTGLEALADEVANPVASFPTDDTGVVVQLPTISASGAPTASGYLVFGIGTESTASGTEADNSLNGATVLPAGLDAFETTFGSQNELIGFIDSGSNGLYFPQPTPNLALCPGGNAQTGSFYCPTSTTSLSATNQGLDGSGNPTGSTSDVSFQIADLNDIPTTNFAINDVGGTATPIEGIETSYFDWGLPFFYGRTIFVAMPAGTTSPYWAY